MNIFRSKFFVFGALMLIGVFGLGFAKSYVRNYNVNKEINSLESAQANLEHERSQLSALLKKIQSTAYAEEQAREEFGLRRPGEKTAVIQRQNSPEKETEQKDKKNLSNPHLWWNRFFGHMQKNEG